MQQQQSDIQQKQEHITGALTDLTAILQGMKNDSRGDSSASSATRTLNIPPGRASWPPQNCSGHFSQQSSSGVSVR